MARGFLSGAIIGGVVSIGVVGVVSVLSPPPASPEIGEVVSGVASPARVTEPGSGETASDNDAALATAPSTPQGQAPDPDTLAALDDDTLSTAAQPQTGGADSLAAPAEETQNGGVTLEGDEPVLPNPMALAPMAPEDADQLSISTEPAQPPVPNDEGVTGAFDDPAQPSAPAEEDAALPAQEEAAVDPSQDPSVAIQLPETEDETTPSTAEAAPEAVAPDAELPETAPEVPAQEQQAAVTDGGPTIGTPSVNLLDRDSGVSIRRPNSDASATSADEASTPSSVSAGEELLPIERFAQNFEAQGDKPLMSIVLIDDGTSPTNGAAGIAALRSFPYPLSFAIDSSLPDAASRMALFRKEGFEVLAMVDLPAGAQPSDVETTFGATLSQLNEVIGVLEGPAASQQSSREVSDQVTEFLSQSGHGWVTQAKGLNTAATVARKKGVPSQPIFRDFDSKDQTAVVIRRFLDQAAFKAGQEGGVIMLGRLRPETISALLLWGLQDRAGQVDLAPVSAVLMKDQ